MSFGLGVMIRMMAPREAIDVTQIMESPITSVFVSDDTFTMTFENGRTLKIKDEGQSCCENRYMLCDDDLSHYVGATFIDAELADGQSVESEYGDHDVQFLRVKTSNGVITVASHNEHNGYYGGFSLEAKIE